VSEEYDRDQRSRSSGDRQGDSGGERRGSSGGDRRGGRSSSRGRYRSGGGRARRARSTACTSRCVGRQVENLSYKQVDALQRYVTDRGKIRSRRQTGNCAKHQRVLARAIKRARFMALLPYTADHGFTSGSTQSERR
jgi:small subunit ribosomal protein S18